MVSPEANNNLHIKADISASSSKSQQHAGPTMPKFPQDIVVAIDGNSAVTRRPIGELVAQSLGAILIDSGRYYRSLAKSCLEAAVNLGDLEAVIAHCSGARLDVWIRRGHKPYAEALLFVNGDLFDEGELAPIRNDARKVARTTAARDRVDTVVRKIAAAGRVVVLGRNVGAKVLPWTPLKFFVTGPIGLNPHEAVYEIGTRLDLCYAGDAVRLTEAFHVPAEAMSPEEACDNILTELANQLRQQEELEKFMVENMSRDH